MSLNGTDRKSVAITLKTTIHNGGETQTYELVLSGTQMFKSSALYLQFEEASENGTIKTTIKYTKEEALLMRSGAVKMRQVFRPGELTNGHYQSIYGTLPMITTTHEMAHKISQDNSEEIIFRYNLEMNGDSLGLYKMSIKYREVA
ncbi:DUF1934 domain-containing protein [Peribacillus saganii]|uniref:DUF1934 domain-containing protein n=1 Tax=Peribacillus saganii TaxID=2303992 RepID=A0A372LRL5_9BACI|nr:DUF1934 domain-containing protein [Peribacillus saganii]RFU70863.1 DUF1934 domain-containing protein [Peribacillus saganii]